MSRQRMQARRRWQLAIAAVGASALLAACSSSATGSTPSPGTTSTSVPGTPAAGPSASCAQIAALRTALTRVSQITVSAKMGSKMSADLTTIETALTALKSDAQSVYAAEAGQIAAYLTVIGQEARLLSLRPTATNLKHTKAALNELKKVVNSVTTGMRADCPSS